MTQHETPACEICGDEALYGDGRYYLCERCEMARRRVVRTGFVFSEGRMMLDHLRDAAFYANDIAMPAADVHRALDALLAVSGEGEMPKDAAAVLRQPDRRDLPPLPMEVC